MVPQTSPTQELSRASQEPIGCRHGFCRSSSSLLLSLDNRRRNLFLPAYRKPAATATPRIISSASPPPELPVLTTPWPANASEINIATSLSQCVGMLPGTPPHGERFQHVLLAPQFTPISTEIIASHVEIVSNEGEGPTQDFQRKRTDPRRPALNQKLAPRVGLEPTTR